MDNLIPEKRMDKNGRLVTRHVRANAGAKSQIGLPKVAPQKTKGSKADKALEKRIRRLDERIRYNFDAEMFGQPQSEALKPILSHIYHPGCTHNEFYDLLEQIPFSEAVVLASYSLKADKLRTFAKKNNMQSCLTDNRYLVGQLRERGIGVDVYYKIITSPEAKTAPIEAVLDAAEFFAMMPGGRYDGIFDASNLYPRYLLSQQASLSDIKEIGIDRCKDTEAFRSVLLKINKGESQSSVKEIGGVLDRTEAMDKENSRSTGDFVKSVGDRAYIAMRVGPGLAESVQNPKAVRVALDIAGDRGDSPEEAVSFCEFVDAYFDADNASSDIYSLTPDVLHPLWKAGITSSQAKDGMAARLTAGQMIAIKTEGITSSVSSGWL